MDTDKPAVDPTSFWDARYGKGEQVGSQALVEGDPFDFTQHPFLYRYAVSMPITGALDNGPVRGGDGFSQHGVLDHIAKRFFDPPPGRLLSIGSGMAFVEEYLVAKGYVQHVTAYEKSCTAVEQAQARMANKDYADQLDLRCGDPLTESLPTAGFDAVFVLAAIHHFDRIEEMYALIHRVLKPGGLLWFDEYVGPDFHMHAPDLMAVMNEVNDCLAPQYRRDMLTRQPRDTLPPPSLEWMLAHDPSEGVHASRILPLTYQWFDVIYRQDYGGAIMRPFFAGILPNFDWADPRDQTVARLIVLIEQMLTRSGVLPNYHTAVVGRRRDQPLPPLTAEEEHRINYSDWPGLAAKAMPQPASNGLLKRLFNRSLPGTKA